jgi:hypothetical protein
MNFTRFDAINQYSDALYVLCSRGITGQALTNMQFLGHRTACCGGRNGYLHVVRL